MRSSVVIVVAACLGLSSAVAASAQTLDLRFNGFDTTAPAEQNLDQLDGLVEAPSKRFDKVWVGTLPGEPGGAVMIGVNDETVAWLTATRAGSFAANDRASIAAMEASYGLPGASRQIGECGAAVVDPGLECTAVFYGCPDAPPTCNVTVLSMRAPGSEGVTRFAWEKSPIDIINPSP